jgi:hypothetical protein
MKIELEAPLHSSFRVQQIAGMFDVPLAEKWRNVDFHGAGSNKRNTNFPTVKDSSQRAVASFEYRGG